MEVKRYSIIIPHKNSPDLLQRCIESIPQRKDIQIIIIDDNSDSCKVDFNHFPGINYSNVELYFTKEGKGAGYVRNIGLKHAKGKWLIFADADDYFTPNAFDIFDKYFNNNAEIVYFCSDSLYDDTKEKADRNIYYNNLIKNYLSGKITEMNLRISFDVPWAKMLKTEFVKQKNIYFDEVPAANDVYFSTLTGFYANRIDVSQDIVYTVTVNVGSITRIRNYRKSFSQYNVYLRKNFFLKKVGLASLQTSIMNRYLESIKYKPLRFFYLTWLLIKFRQNPFIGYKNWIKTLIKITKKSITEKRFYTK